MANERVHLSPASGELQITLDLLLRNMKTLIATTGCAIVLGVAYLAVASPTHEFSARLLVLSGDRPLDEVQKKESDLFLPTQAEIIRSPAVIQKSLESIAAPADELSTQDVLGRLEVQPLLGTSVMTLRLQDADQEAGMKLLNAIIANYKTYIRDTEQTMNRETITLLLDREKELRNEILLLQGQYDKAHNAGPLVGRDSLLATPRARLETVQTLLATSQSRRVYLESYLRQLKSLESSLIAVDDPDATVPTSIANTSPRQSNHENSKLTPPLLANSPWAASLEILTRMDTEGLVRSQDPLVHQALLDARSQEAEITQRFGPRHPDVRAIQSRIRSLEARIQEAVRVAPEILANELVSVRSQEEELQLSYEREFALCKNLDAAVIREQQFLDQLQSVQVIHDTILSQINRFELADEAISGGRSSVSVRLLDGPQLVPGGTWPQPVPVLGLCGILGLAAGFLIVVVSNRTEFQLCAERWSSNAVGTSSV
ncbi:MAG: hypothetical protein ABI614_01010 [Planctomycetota bacterium]